MPNEVVVETAPGTDAQVLELAKRHRLTPLDTVNLELTGTTITRLRITDRRPVPVVVGGAPA